MVNRLYHLSAFKLIGGISRNNKISDELMLNSISLSFNHLHNFVYSSNYYKVAKMTVGIGMVCGLVATLFIQIITAKDRESESADAPHYFKYVGTLYSMALGAKAGAIATIISGVTIFVLKSLSPRIH